MEFIPLSGGLAHETFVAHVDDERYVVKFVTDDLVRHHLMIPHDQLIHNTRSVGAAGVGAGFVLSLGDPPIMVLNRRADARDGGT